MDLKKYTNSIYEILEYFYKLYKENPQCDFTKASQEEIAKSMHFSKKKVNRIINNLVEYGDLLKINLKGKYLITNKGKMIVEKLEGTRL